MEDRYALRNAKLVTGEHIDVVIESGKIAALVPAGQGEAEQVHDMKGRYVSSGWIDMHVHAFAKWDPYGDEIDEIGIKQGVTTIVDAGSCGAENISELLAASAQVKTRLLAFINLSSIGLQRVDELSNAAWLDREALRRAVERDPHQIIGIKVRMSSSVIGSQGLAPLKLARELADELSLPLMVHIGSAPPQVAEILPWLVEGDILTHYLHGKANSLFDQAGKPLAAFVDAIERGVRLDVGHGSASFSFETAKLARDCGIPLGTISTDIYRRNRLSGPVYSLAHVMSKLLYLGYSLQEVITAVTTRAALGLNKPELGRIQVGDAANLTLFRIIEEPLWLVDAHGNQRQTASYLTAEGVVKDGQYITCEART